MGDISVDAIVALQFPDGSLAFYPAQGVPLYSGIIPGESELQPIEFLNLLLTPGFPPRAYSWYVALLARGSSALLGDVASASFTVE